MAILFAQLVIGMAPVGSIDLARNEIAGTHIEAAGARSEAEAARTEAEAAQTPAEDRLEIQKRIITRSRLSKVQPGPDAAEIHQLKIAKVVLEAQVDAAREQLQKPASGRAVIKLPARRGNLYDRGYVPRLPVQDGRVPSMPTPMQSFSAADLSGSDW